MKKNIPVASPDIGSKEAIKVFNTVKSGWISMGSIVRQFEKIYVSSQVQSMQLL